ncbi:glycosyltransferase family 2 protein [Algoriphagus namhaensis]|uniref:Glycosyltransferase family 2 protein n=1 Tax=Algoriphagus namhaensis TaxID=915353 RepID=A0ABV8AR08_9BACT
MDSTLDVRVAIILVNWNGLDFTRSCLDSLRKVDFPDFQVFVVDNASQNKEAEVLKSAFPEIELIQSRKNRGFTGGNNLGIQAALDQAFSHVLLLNNDTLVEPDFLKKMMETMQSDPNLGVVQPMICFLHDRGKIWSAGGKWNSLFCRAMTLGDRKKLDGYEIKSNNLDWATGCALLISKKALEAVGTLDDNFFAYFEDVDWSLRIRKAGFEIALCEAAKIYHEAGASSKQKGSEGTLSPRVFYFHARNQFYLIRKHSGGAHYFLAVIYHSFRFLAWMVYFCLRGRFKKLNAVFNGFRDGLTDTLLEVKEWR